MRQKADRLSFYGDEARHGLLKGIRKTNKAVSVTLGPKGRVVVLENQYRHPHATKDGVTVANTLGFKDPLENLGSQIIQEAASRAGYFAGDGTTTATVLAASIVEHVFAALGDNRGPIAKLLGIGKPYQYNYVDIKRGIDKAGEDLTIALRSMVTAATPKIVIDVATVSANGDTLIGNMVGEAVNKVGAKGAINIVESETNENKVTFAEGYQLNSGWFDPIFVNNPKNGQAEYANAKVLIIDQTISKRKDFEQFMKKYEGDPNPLVILASGFQGEMLASLVETRRKLGSAIILIKAPSFSPFREDFMRDVATYTGAKLFGEITGQHIRNFDMKDLGECTKVICEQNQTTFIGGAGKPDRIAQEIALMEGMIPTATESQQKHFHDRISALKADVAKIEVGSNSTLEQREVLDRLDDAIKSARAALEEGVVIGGGGALAHAVLQAKNNTKDKSFQLGYQSVLKAALEPLNQICFNCGVDPSPIIEEIQGLGPQYGYDAVNDRSTKLMGAGIVDPLKVTRIALESAVSVVGTLILTECVVVFDGNPNPANEPR